MMGLRYRMMLAVLLLPTAVWADEPMLGPAIEGYGPTYPIEDRDVALKNVLTNEAYRARYDTDNPNLELLQKLHAAGVAIYVCGQSMAFGKVTRDELASPAQVALSAMTMLIVLQEDGYALLP